MIKNDALNEIIDLDYHWANLLDDIYEEEFNYDLFKPLAVHTFSFLFTYRDAEVLPREIMSILFKIKEFASYPVGGISPQSDCRILPPNWLRQNSAIRLRIVG